MHRRLEPGEVVLDRGHYPQKRFLVDSGSTLLFAFRDTGSRGLEVWLPGVGIDGRHYHRERLGLN